MSDNEQLEAALNTIEVLRQEVDRLNRELLLLRQVKRLADEFRKNLGGIDFDYELQKRWGGR
jgi:hypothetical protein